MTTIKYIEIVGLTILVACILFAIQIPVRTKAKRPVRIALWVFKALVCLVLAFCLISIASRFLWLADYPLSALYLVLLADVVIEPFLLFIPKLNSKKASIELTALSTLVFLCYAIVNMQRITPDYHTYTSEKLDHTYKVVFVSDLHYGSSQSRNTVMKAIEAIGQEHPDYLLLGGDIVDEHTTKEEMEDVFRAFGALDAKTYYIYGNHDRQDRFYLLNESPYYSEPELEQAILSSGITILYNDWEQVEDDLVLLGMEDPSRPDKRIAISELRPRPDNTYVIALEHTPYQNDDIKETKADLQLSGHTHAGQFFPIRWLYTIAGLNTVGEYNIGDTTLYVSPGIAGWYLPLRSESHCHYEVITFSPKN